MTHRLTSHVTAGATADLSGLPRSRSAGRLLQLAGQRTREASEAACELPPSASVELAIRSRQKLKREALVDRQDSRRRRTTSEAQSPARCQPGQKRYTRLGRMLFRPYCLIRRQPRPHPGPSSSTTPRATNSRPMRRGGSARRSPAPWPTRRARSASRFRMVGSSASSPRAAPDAPGSGARATPRSLRELDMTPEGRRGAEVRPSHLLHTPLGEDGDSEFGDLIEGFRGGRAG